MIPREVIMTGSGRLLKTPTLRYIDKLENEIDRLAASPQPVVGDREAVASAVLDACRQYASAKTGGILDDSQKAYIVADATDAILASLASRPEGGWRPIETAPDQGEVLVGVWVDGRWSSWTIGKEPSATTPFGCDGEYGDEPTHWMPLPPPPSGGGRVMGDHQAILNRIAEVSHAVGSQARVSASEVAGLIVSFLYANPEYTDRFMVEGSDLLVDGTITPEAGSLSYMSANGSIMTPRELRASTGRLET